MNLQPVPAVAGDALPKAQRALVLDAAWASLTGALSGGVLIVSFALFLGASPLQIGALASISLIAQVAQLPAIALVHRLRRRKQIVIVALTVARIAIPALALLTMVPASGQAVMWLMAAQFVITALGSVAGCALNSWLHQLLPQDRLGRFFSRRLLAATVISCAGTLAAGWLVDHPVGADPRHAYALAFVLAGIAGFVNLGYLARCPEPAMAPPHPSDTLLEALKAPFRDRPFRALLVLLASWNVAGNLAAPFVTVFLMQQLGFGLAMVTSLWVASQLANATTLFLWGKVPDRLSNKAVLRVALPAYFFSAVALVFCASLSGSPQLVLLFGVHMLLGTASGGIALASGNLGLKFAPKDRATPYLTAASLVSAVAGGITPVIAGAVAEWFAMRHLSIVVRWMSPSGTRDVSVLSFAHWEFLFALSALAGLFVMHALSRIEEGREVSERRVVQELGLETLRTVTHLSSIGGVLAMLFQIGNAASRAQRGGENAQAAQPSARTAG
jgi:MFS family permease